MSSALKKYANSKQLIGFLADDNDDGIRFIVIDPINEKFVTKFEYKDATIKALFDDIQKYANCFKAFIINLFGLELESTPYHNIIYNFCIKLQEILNRLKIPSCFISEVNFLLKSLLIALEVDGILDEIIFLILPEQTKNKKPSNFFDITVFEFKFTPFGYQLINQKDLKLKYKKSPESLYQEICGTSNPKKIVLSTSANKKIPFQKIFKQNLLSTDSCLCCYYQDKCLIEICKWLYDKSYIKYHILPTSVLNIQIFGEYGLENNRLDILEVEINAQLPITKKAIFTGSVPELNILSKDSYSREFGSTPKLPKLGHYWEITLTIDENNLAESKMSHVEIKNFNLLPVKMTINTKSKVPFIGFYDNSSVIGICGNNGKYEFLDEWNGLYGMDCFISFDQKRPNFGEKAVECLKIKNTFVVFDLLKIMSMPPNDIKVSNTWGFTFTKDAKNPVLLEFDSFDGTKKASSPSFLMALYLRQHLKAIQTKIGEKPKDIAIWIFEKKFSEDEMERIKEGLEESCRLLKLGCCFVDTESDEVDYLKIG